MKTTWPGNTFYEEGEEKSLKSLQACVCLPSTRICRDIKALVSSLFCIFLKKKEEEMLHCTASLIIHWLNQPTNQYYFPVCSFFLPFSLDPMLFNFLKCQLFVLCKDLCFSPHLSWLLHSLESRTGWDRLFWESGPYLTSSRLGGTFGQWPHCVVCTNHCCSKWRIDTVKGRDVHVDE